MKKMVAFLLCIALLLPACALAQEVVNVFNWEDYIDESVLQDFEAETGIHVNYMRFTTNEDMLVQVGPCPTGRRELPGQAGTEPGASGQQGPFGRDQL